MNAKLSLVGSGIKTISHLTKETESHIISADIVLYLINEPVLEEWIRKKSKESFDLEGLYFSNELRRNCYNSIRDKILEYTEQYNFVCVVLNLCTGFLCAGTKGNKSLYSPIRRHCLYGRGDLDGPFEQDASLASRYGPRKCRYHRKYKAGLWQPENESEYA